MCVAGTISLTLDRAIQDQSAGPASLDVRYQRAPGGNFVRRNFPLALLTVPPDG